MTGLIFSNLLNSVYYMHELFWRTILEQFFKYHYVTCELCVFTPRGRCVSTPRGRSYKHQEPENMYFSVHLFQKCTLLLYANFSLFIHELYCGIHFFPHANFVHGIFIVLHIFEPCQFLFLNLFLFLLYTKKGNLKI